MKKVFILTLVLLIALQSVFAGGSQEGATTDDGLTKIKVAHHLGYSGAAVMAVGLEKGFFEEEGLAVEPVPFTSGPTEVAALVSGDLQFGYIGSGATTLAVEGDVEVVCYQNLGDSEVIVVNKNSGINSIKDLKGKTIATTLGTSGENIVNLALEEAGLSRNDVELINMDMGGCVTAIIAGRVDAVCVWGSYLVTVRQQLGDNFLALARTSDFDDKYASVSSWLTTQSYIDENPEVVQHFVNAVVKSMDYWKTHEEEVAGLVAELLDSDPQNIKDQIGTVFFFDKAELKENLENGNIEQYYYVQQQSMYDTGKISEMVDLDTYIHWEYMENAVNN